MSSTLDQIVWPFQLTISGEVLTAPQNSDADIASCMATIILWPLGTHDLNPEFGTPEEAFLQGGPDLGEIRQALQTNEPRAEETVTLDDPTLAGFVANVRVGFSPTLGPVA